MHPAAAGTEPGETISREVTVVGHVVAVDAKGTQVTIKGPQGTMDVLSDPEQLKNVRQVIRLRLCISKRLRYPSRQELASSHRESSGVAFLRHSGKARPVSLEPSY